MGNQKVLSSQTRGIRKSDPLSPFLFLIYIEGLHSIISQMAQQDIIHGLSLSSRSPKLTHLLFANGGLLFYKSTLEECQKVLDILGVYERCLTQQINRNKTTIFFSKFYLGRSEDSN